MKWKFNKWVLVLAGLFATTLVASDTGHDVLKKRIPISREKRLVVNVKYGNGYINFSKIQTDNVFEGEFIYGDVRPDVQYEVVGDEGRLDVVFSGKWSKDDVEEETHSIGSINKIYDNELDLGLSSRLPLDMELELGVVKGKMDLGGLRLKNLNLEVGVSKGSIVFNEPNPESLDFCSVEGGVGKLSVEKLGNANLREFKFDGGVGAYVLDFSGELKQNLKARINLGMGKMTLYIPRTVGTRLKIQKSLFSSCSIDEIYKKGNFYYNDSWQESDHKLDIQLDAGIGKINVIWVDHQ